MEFYRTHFEKEKEEDWDGETGEKDRTENDPFGRMSLRRLEVDRKIGEDELRVQWGMGGDERANEKEKKWDAENDVNGFGDYQKKGVEKIKQNALDNKANIQAMDIICSARKEGMTFQQIADKLNKLQYTTRRGKSCNPIQVQRLYKRCEDV